MMTAFEFDGEKYKKCSQHQKEMGRQLISELQLLGNEAVLDLGCGDGVLTHQLARLVPKGKVIGIDASIGMIETARKLQADNLIFLHMDINDMTFENEFDLVFSNATLHWIKDHRSLLGNIYKGLKADGAVRYNFAGAGNCANLYAVLRHVMSEKDFTGYFENFEWPWYMPAVGDYDEIVCQFDFQQKRVWGEITDGYFANVEEMVGWIDQPCLVPFLKQLDDKKDKERFRGTVIHEMIERTRQTDGRCFETGRRINVFARKW